MRRFLILFCVLTAAGALAPKVKAAAPYSITAIAPAAGSNFSTADGINNNDQVIGFSADLNVSTSISTGGLTDVQGILYSDGTSTLIPPLVGGSANIPYGINDSGEVAGISSADLKSSNNTAYTYQSGVLTNLGALLGSFTTTGAQDINNSGQIVGGTNTSNGVTAGFIYNNGSNQPLSLGQILTVPLAINASGQVVGFLTNTKTTGNAFLFSNGTVTNISPLPGDNVNTADAINTQGNIVGLSASTTSTPPTFTAAAEIAAIGDIRDQVTDLPNDVIGHGYFYNAKTGTETDLGTLGGSFSNATAINDSNDIVGTSATASGDISAFLDTGSGMVNLNSLIPAGSGWTLITADDINNAGDIVGLGEFNGTFEGYFLTAASNSGTGTGTGTGGNGNGGGTGTGTSTGTTTTGVVPLPPAIISGFTLLLGLAAISRIKHRRPGVA